MFATRSTRFELQEAHSIRMIETSQPRMLVAIALANKMARMIWAMLTKQEDYRTPATALAA